MNYIDREEMQKEVLSSLENGRCTERLGEMLIQMHDHILTHRNWQGYHLDLKQEMRSYSLMRCLTGLKNFTPDKGDAFSYFTSAIFMNYLSVVSRFYKRTEKEKKIQELVQEMRQLEHGKGIQTMNGKPITTEEGEL